MKEKGIPFSAPMVRAILDGKKTQTRRIVNPQPDFAQIHRWNGREIYDGEARHWCWKEHDFGDGDPINANPGPEMAALCRYGVPGDRLWVQETHVRGTMNGGSDRWVKYKASEPDGNVMRDGSKARWITPWFMPRWASRIILEVTDVRVERLQSITEADARAEGVEPTFIQESWACFTKHGAAYDVFVEPDQDHRERNGLLAVVHRPAQQLSSARDVFEGLWKSIHSVGSWIVNPWVWVISFRRIEP